MRIYPRASFQPAASDKGMIYPRRMPGGGGPVPPDPPLNNILFTLLSPSSAIVDGVEGNLSWLGTPLNLALNGFGYSGPSEAYGNIIDAYITVWGDDFDTVSGVTIGSVTGIITICPDGWFEEYDVSNNARYRTGTGYYNTIESALVNLPPVMIIRPRMFICTDSNIPGKTVGEPSTSFGFLSQCDSISNTANIRLPSAAFSITYP